MIQITWTENSKRDLKEIYTYIAFDSKYYAKETIIKLRQRTNILKLQISIGRIVPEFDNKLVRELIEGNYRNYLQNNFFKQNRHNLRFS
ncbi:MAG: type II toxin-antitoxin system RelE/ParE family toxin [Chitinophagales bacterium]|jgi:toxin ParE1/3/4|nr:type II toxin-antitoxin system RelE/ParE family toxin [Sphingobacteriales bacterium]